MAVFRAVAPFLFPLLMSLPAVCTATPCPRTTSTSRILHIAHQTKGVLTVSFDPTNPDPQESLQILSATQAGHQPGWLCSHGDGILYSVSRTQYPDNSSTSGGAFTFQTIPEGLELVGDTSTDGNGGVFCDINKDGTVFSVANIDGSTVSLHHRSVPDGKIGDSFHVFEYNLTQPGPGWNDSQIQANPHQAIFEPSGKFMFVPDRGADFVYGYEVPSGPSAGTEARQVANITLPPGTGARHIGFKVLDESSTLMYLVSELDNTIRVFRLDGVDNNSNTDAKKAPRTSPSSQSLQITLLQVASTLGPGSDRTAPHNINLASELALSNDGRFVYVANRNTQSEQSDTLTIFATNPILGSAEPQQQQPLTYLGQNATYGKIPRHFSLSSDPDNLYVAVANEVSNNVLVFRRDVQTGFLEEGLLGNLTLGAFDVKLQEGPMAVVWA